MNFRAARACGLLAALVTLSARGQAASLEFKSRELFQIPFGTDKESLGAKVQDGNFLLPRDFSVDANGRFYINDSNKHRVIRVSPRGEYRMGISYPASAEQVFAQPDGLGNLWLLISDPVRGFYYGVYDGDGKKLREGVFAQYNKFRLHVDDARVLNVMLSNKKKPQDVHTYFLDPESFLLKKIAVAPPPEEHHTVVKLERSYYIDPVPTHATNDSERRMKITDKTRQSVEEIRGRVVYVTEQSEIYTRVGDCQFEIYDVTGSKKGQVTLKSLPAVCAGVRFDPQGNIYLLDGTPDASGKYSADMPGMRLMVWERK